MDEEILTDASWALSYLSDGGYERIQTVINTGVVGKLINNLELNTITVLIPTIRIIGNIVSGTDEQTNIVLQSGGLDPLFKLLNHQKQAVKQEVCWVLSNIAAGTQEQIHLLLSNDNFMNILFEVLENDSVEIKREAAWIISNASQKAFHQDIYLLVTKYKILEKFITLLNSKDSKTVIITLESLKNILSIGEQFYLINQDNIFLLELEQLGGTKFLENLQLHQNRDIYEKALDLLECYYEIEDPI